MVLFCVTAGCREVCEGAPSRFQAGGMGAVVARLLRELPVSVPEALIERAKVLDNFYVPSRYPNGHPEGAPFEHYGPLQSEEAIRYAGEIIEFVRVQMAEQERS